MTRLFGDADVYVYVPIWKPGSQCLAEKYDYLPNKFEIRSTKNETMTQIWELKSNGAICRCFVEPRGARFAGCG